MKVFVVFIVILGAMFLGTASFAATCPESVPAPKYQVGDRFTWKYTNGKAKEWEVTGVEGNLAQVKWSDGGSLLDSDTAGSYFLDQDWVIRKAVNKNGDELLSPRLGAFAMIGKEFLSFPLHLGKTWRVTFVTKGVVEIRTFYLDLKVVGCEEVVTLAGKFQALKIEGKLTNETFRGWVEPYMWYSPDAKNVVRHEVRYCTQAQGWCRPGIPLSQEFELMNLELR